MSNRINSWATRIVLAVLWVAITAGVAYFVARHAGSNDPAGGGRLVAPPISLADRQTATLATQTIQPVLSGDGRVVKDGTDWALEAPVTPEAQAYQLLNPPIAVKALIQGGPAGFACAWLGLGQAADGSVTMRCRIPAEVKVVAGLPGTMVLQLTRPQDKPALPVTAVLGSSGQGEVVVVHGDGTTEVRPVGIGQADTFWVEITSGLKPDEKVLEAPVQTDFSRPGK